MTEIEPPHRLGLAIYTFEDLHTRRQAVTKLLSLLLRLVPGLDASIFEVAHVSSSQKETDLQMQGLAWEHVVPAIEAGTVARFHTIPPVDMPGTQTVLRLTLDRVQRSPERPNFLWLWLPLQSSRATREQTVEGFVEFAQEVFEQLGGSYGYAGLGASGGFDEANSHIVSEGKYAIPSVQFFDINIESSFPDRIKDVFWANFLSKHHVDKLGGSQMVEEAAVGCETRRLPSGGLLLLLGRDPLSPDMSVQESSYATLRKFLAPIIVSRVAPIAPRVLTEDPGVSKYREIGLKTMESHVREFEEKYLNIGKLPRNYVWRPYRFCVQDVVIGLVVVRHSLENNCLEVDVCLTSDVPEYEPHSGAKMTATFLLSEAYKCGGTMEIRFSDYVEGGRVPAALCRLARELGVCLNHAEEGRITPSEARQFYLALTEFSPLPRDHFVELSTQGKLSVERACYVVHHGVWTRSEVESIVLGSQRPDSILGGETSPEQRHLYMQDIAHARAAILGGFLDRKLARRERGEGDVAIDLEDDVRRLESTFDPEIYAKVYRCDEDLQLPWLADGSETPSSVPAGDRLVALVRARDATGSELHFRQDLDVAGAVVKSFRQQAEPTHVFILAPRDFEQYAQHQRASPVAQADERGVSIMVCPETVASLDTDAAKRLARSRILRQ